MSYGLRSCDSLEAVNEKFRKLVGSNASADNMEREVDRLLSYVYNWLLCFDLLVLILWRS